jgi:hypothetical protein
LGPAKKVARLPAGSGEVEVWFQFDPAENRQNPISIPISIAISIATGTLQKYPVRRDQNKPLTSPSHPAIFLFLPMLL